MIFGSTSDGLDVSLTEWASGDSPAGYEHDPLLNVAVWCDGFRGSDQVWVLRAAWSGFLAQFREMERTRRGAAELTGLMPGELRARFFVYDRAGHAAVEGHIARTRHVAGEARELRLVYHLEFDPGELATAVREFGSWAAG